MGDLEGDGTENKPYIISDEEDLKNISGKPNISYKLVSDIDCSKLKSRNIRFLQEKFRGNLNGNQHEIKNINFESPRGPDRFIDLNEGIIKNLTLDNIKANGVDFVEGILVNSNKGILDNVTIKNSCIKGKRTIGGIVGSCSGKVKNCSVVSTSVECDGKKAGGIAGINSSLMKNCLVKDIKVSGKRSLGFISGMNRVITNCKNIVKNSTVINSEMKGKSSLGGIAGINKSHIKNCKVRNSNIKGEKWSGGISGSSNGKGVIKSCLETRNRIECDSIAGGVAGISAGKVSTCESSSKIISNTKAGGIVGKNLGTIKKSCTKSKIEDKKPEDYSARKLGLVVGVTRRDSKIIYVYYYGKESDYPLIPNRKGIIKDIERTKNIKKAKKKILAKEI